MDWENKTVLVTGGHGFLGTHVIEKLQVKNPKKLIVPSSNECDLRKQSDCKKIVQDIDIVLHLAGKGGGIGIMREKPGEIFYDNIMMGTNIFHEAKESGVEKFVALGTVCSYPKFAALPFSEDAIWEGYPEETNAAYGLSKKMLLVQSQAYRQQFNFKSVVLVPTNIYGPRDDFNLKTSHVIPALISKIHDANISKQNKIVIWGDGSPTRDFLYVEDAADGIILAAEKYDDDMPLNLGSEEEISIKNLVDIITKQMSFQGTIEWDTSKPNGQPRRCVSNKRAEEKIGFTPKIKLHEGIRRTIDWFIEQK